MKTNEEIIKEDNKIVFNEPLDLEDEVRIPRLMNKARHSQDIESYKNGLIYTLKLIGERSDKCHDNWNEFEEKVWVVLLQFRTTIEEELKNPPLEDTETVKSK